MGKLTQAPLFLTVAEVRFNTILSLETFVPAVQENLRRHGYPDYRPADVLSFKFSPQEAGSPAAHRLHKYIFLSMDKRAAFVLAPGSVSFHTSKYEVFEAFARDLMQGVEIIQEILGLTYTDRIGVRYLDAVLPRPNETLQQYLIPELVGLGQKLDGEFEQSFSQTRMVLPQGQLIARCLIRSGRVGIPQDLQPIGLELAERFTVFEGQHALLDTDAAREERQPFSVADIKTRIYSLHKHIGTAFRAAVTDYARKVWE